MKTIVLLTEDESNESVKLIANAIELQCAELQQSGILMSALIIEKKVGDHLTIEHDALITLDSGLYPKVIIHLKDIAFVMVRTWTDKRDPVIALAEALKRRSVSVADTDLMPWTLSKIAQYRSLEGHKIFPKSVCLDEKWMSAYESQDQNAVIQQVKRDVSELGYPLIIKASRGSRGTGVYRVTDEEGLIEFLSDHLWGSMATSNSIKRYGLIFQTFVNSTEQPTLSDRSLYLRVNVVNQEICSVVQFELGWHPVTLDSESRHYSKIIEKISDPLDKPIMLSDSLMEWYKDLLPLLPFPLGVAGLDIMQDEKGHYFLLEVNCGPSVSLIESLGMKYPEKEEGLKCSKFSSQIAFFCIQQALNTLKNAIEESTRISQSI